jgi:sulfonate transport system permease protein
LNDIEQAITATKFDQVQAADETASPQRSLTPGLGNRVLGNRGLLLLSWIASALLVIVWEVLARGGWISPLGVTDHLAQL